MCVNNLLIVFLDVVFQRDRGRQVSVLPWGWHSNLCHLHRHLFSSGEFKIFFQIYLKAPSGYPRTVLRQRKIQTTLKCRSHLCPCDLLMTQSWTKWESSVVLVKERQKWCYQVLNYKAINFKNLLVTCP